MKVATMFSMPDSCGLWPAIVRYLVDDDGRRATRRLLDCACARAADRLIECERESQARRGIDQDSTALLHGRRL
jgi:hypothetical protein